MKLGLYFGFMLFLGCGSHSITKVSFTYKMPVRLSEDFVEPFESVFYKTKYKDAMIYELPYKETYQLNGELILDTMKHNYFIFNPNDSFGYKLLSVTDSFGSKRNVDSTLTSTAFKTLDIDKIYSIVKSSQTERVNDSIFIKRGKLEKVQFDSVYFYFNDHLKGLDYTLSRELDSSYHSKLYKVELLSNKDTSQYAEYLNRFRIISYEINKSKVENRADLEFLYKRFKKLPE
jgi:hypothetical protein